MINYHLLQKRTPIENDKFKFKHFPLPMNQKSVIYFLIL